METASQQPRVTWNITLIEELVISSVSSREDTSNNARRNSNLPPHHQLVTLTELPGQTIVKEENGYEAENESTSPTSVHNLLFCDSCTMHGNVTEPFLLVISLVRNKQFFVCARPKNFVGFLIIPLYRLWLDKSKTRVILKGGKFRRYLVQRLPLQTACTLLKAC